MDGRRRRPVPAALNRLDDISRVDAELIVDALSDAQLTRAFSHADRARAATELAAARRAEAATPSPLEVREADALELQDVIAAQLGGSFRRLRLLYRLTMVLIGLWAATIVAIGVIFWINQRAPGSVERYGIIALLISFFVMLAAATVRMVYLPAAQRHRQRTLATVLEWASQDRRRLERGLEGLPSYQGFSAFNDFRLYFASGLLLIVAGVLIPVLVFTAGATTWGYLSIVIGLPLVAAGIATIAWHPRMERRRTEVARLMAALAHPSSAALMRSWACDR